MMCSAPSIGLGPDAEQGNACIERPRKFRPAFHIVVTPTAAEGIVVVAALRSGSSFKQPQLARVVVPLDERQEVPHHRGIALVTL
jgi:hypothetical protein